MSTMILQLIYLASGSALIGIVMTFIMILICGYFQIDINQHLWIVAIPVVLSLTLNVIFIELYRKFHKK